MDTRLNTAMYIKRRNEISTVIRDTLNRDFMGYIRLLFNCKNYISVL